jgi:hypothetical protein
MPSLEDFRTKLNGDDNARQQAMTDYVINVDAASLDGDTSKLQACREQEVSFVFQDPNVIIMRAKQGGDANAKKIWYLPWFVDGASKAVLGPDGPAYFSTSQLDGCRFTIQYDDASRKRATVLHLSGRLGMGNKLSEARNAKEVEEFGALPHGPLVRRYSSASLAKTGSPKLKAEKAAKALKDNETILYSGNKAFIWGFRKKDGVWDFFAHEIENDWQRGDTGLGYKALTG